MVMMMIAGLDRNKTSKDETLLLKKQVVSSSSSGSK
jgi:hypothetical protein